MKHTAKTKLLAALLFAALLITALPINLLAAEAPEPGGEEIPAQTTAEAENGQIPQPNPKYPEIVPIQMDIESISANLFHTMALDADGNVYTWGNNTHGALGNGTATGRAFTMTHIELPGRAVQVAAGQEVSLALLEDGTVYDWGTQSAMAYLGDTRNGSPAQYIPAKVPEVPAIQSIEANKGAFAIATNGVVWSWGSNEGEIGRGGGTLKHRRSPAKTSMTNASAVYQLDVAGFVTTKTGVYGWCRAVTGVIDIKYILGTSLLRSTPIKTELKDVRYIGGSGNTLFVVNNSGRLQVWGNRSTNDYGVLGLGHTDKTDKKLTIAIDSGVVKVQAPGAASLVLKEDGTVWSTGRNNGGLLGLGIEDASYFVTEFTQIEGLENVVDLVVSNSNTAYAKTADGCWWAWGSVANSMLPSGGTSYKSVDSPVLIFAPTGYTPVDPGPGPDPEPDTHTITLTETWADNTQPDATTTHEAEDGKAFAATFTTPAGYTAEVASDVAISVNYEAGRLYIPSVTGDIDITITYTPEEGPTDPEPDTHTITLTETWADGTQPDVVNTYEVEDARPFSALFTTPAGYTAEVICAENLSINYEAMRVYLYSVKNSFDIVVTYAPETLSGYTPET